MAAQQARLSRHSCSRSFHGGYCPRVGFITHGKRQKLDSAILAKGDSKFQALIELFVLPLKLDSILYQKNAITLVVHWGILLYGRSERTTAQRASNIHSYQHPTDSIIRAEQFSIAIRQTALQTFHPTLVVVGRKIWLRLWNFQNNWLKEFPMLNLLSWTGVVMPW